MTDSQDAFIQLKKLKQREVPCACSIFREKRPDGAHKLIRCIEVHRVTSTKPRHGGLQISAVRMTDVPLTESRGTEAIGVVLGSIP
jgi:hypothetical protein